MYNTLQFDQYLRLAILLKKKNLFSAKNSKTNPKFEKKAFHNFVELVETNPLMYNVKDLG